MRLSAVTICFVSVFLASAAGQPSISGIVNGASFVPAGLPNGNIAQGSIFSIFGTGLGPSTSPPLSFPLERTLGGVKVHIAPASGSIEAIPLYVGPGQINALLPSTVAGGTAAVTVEYPAGQVSNAYTITIVPSSVGLFTTNQSGSGQAAALNVESGTETRQNAINRPAHPGQIVELWATGLGPVSFDETQPPEERDMTADLGVEVFVADRVIRPLYAGRSPQFAGVDQINIALTADIAMACYVPISVRVNGVTSNAASLAIASGGTNEMCSDDLTISMATARVGHTATLLSNGKVLVAGGDDASGELFDPASAGFTPTGNMTTRRYGATATLLGSGKVLIVGGYGPCSTECPLLNTAEVYDPLTNTFSATGSMSQARAFHTGTLLANGKVLIAGGGGFGALASAELYDPATGAFTSVDSMITDREEHTATLLADGEVLIAGGWNGHAADSLDDPPWDPLFAELFASSSGSFGISGSMSTTRIGHTATRLPNGKVLMFGGIPNQQNIHDQPPAPANTELYDPVSRTFSSAGNTEISRYGHTATLLPNGTVLIAGGHQQEPSASVLASAELFDPASGSFTATRGLVTGRWGHTATLLSDGRVLITGGTDRAGATLASAEIYK